MNRAAIVAGYAISAFLTYLAMGLVAMLFHMVLYHQPPRYRVTWLVPEHKVVKHGR